jgi:hypothetical protein
MRLRNLYRLTFHPSPQWRSVSLWQRWRFVLSGALRREEVKAWTDAYLGDLDDPVLLAKGPAECVDCGVEFATLGDWKWHIPDCRPYWADMTLAEIQAAYERAKAMPTTEQRLRTAVRAVNIFYKLAVKLQEATDFSPNRGVYETPPEEMDDLSDFLADFHDDNPDLWNLLLKDTRNEVVPTTTQCGTASESVTTLGRFDSLASNGTGHQDGSSQGR